MRPFLATKAFLAGIAVGLLYAPRSGAALRTQLLNSFADRQSDIANKAKESIGGLTGQGRQSEGQRQPDYVPLPNQSEPRPYFGAGTAPAAPQSNPASAPAASPAPTDPVDPADSPGTRRRNRTSDTTTDGLAGADGSA